MHTKTTNNGQQTNKQPTTNNQQPPIRIHFGSRVSAQASVWIAGALGSTPIQPSLADPWCALLGATLTSGREPAWHRRARARRAEARVLLRLAGSARLLKAHHSARDVPGTLGSMAGGCRQEIVPGTVGRRTLRDADRRPLQEGRGGPALGGHAQAEEGRIRTGIKVWTPGSMGSAATGTPADRGRQASRWKWEGPWASAMLLLRKGWARGSQLPCPRG